MKKPLKLILLIVFVLDFHNAFCQSYTKFCSAVENESFKKVERMVKKQVHKYRNGTTYNYGQNDCQTTFKNSFDSITLWLKNQSCIEDSFWDKCQEKAAIYPWSSTIGVQFRTKKGIVEKCFLIQEGKTGQVNIFGWRPKIFKSKKILFYKKMYNCTNFIEQQKINCQRVNQQYFSCKISQRMKWKLRYLNGFLLFACLPISRLLTWQKHPGAFVAKRRK